MSLVVLIGHLVPRVVIAALALTTDQLSRAFESVLWPLLGFFLLPVTTLAWVVTANTGVARGGGRFFVVAVALLADVALFTGGRTRLERRGGRDTGVP